MVIPHKLQSILYHNPLNFTTFSYVKIIENAVVNHSKYLRNTSIPRLLLTVWIHLYNFNATFNNLRIVLHGILNASPCDEFYMSLSFFLTHWGRVTYICVGKLTIIGSDNGLALGAGWPAPSHYLNQCWNIVDCTLVNKLHWNLNCNLFRFIKRNAFGSVLASVCEDPDGVSPNLAFFMM